jgi:hypothetical protein
MRENRDPDDSWIAERQEIFQNVMHLINTVMDVSAFRVTDEVGRPTERVINRAVFEAQALVFSICNRDEALARAQYLRQSLASLFSDGDYDQLIRSATGDRARTLGRVRDTVGAFQNAGVSVDLSLLGGGVVFPPRQR